MKTSIFKAYSFNGISISRHALFHKDYRLYNHLMFVLRSKTIELTNNLLIINNKLPNKSV